jgi:hypothetical protein
VKPAKPVLASTNPTSPSKVTNPIVRGSADVGTTVRLFTDLCVTQNGGSATPFANRSFGITAVVPPNATSTFRANATDVAGNVSDCSDPLVYVSDNLAPAAPFSSARRHPRRRTSRRRPSRAAPAPA